MTPAPQPRRVIPGHLFTTSHMLTGTHYCMVDAKGRVVIPAVLRQELGETLILVRAPGATALVLTPEQWAQRREDRIGPQLRDYFASGAVETRAGFPNGRIQLTYPLRQHLGVWHGEDVAVVGLGDVALLCASARWNTHVAELERRLVAFLLG